MAILKGFTKVWRQFIFIEENHDRKAKYLKKVYISEIPEVQPEGAESFDIQY